MYQDILAEIRQEIDDKENKGPIIFNDQQSDDYLGNLRKKFSSMKTFPGAFDLVVIGEKAPSISSKFRFIRLINPVYPIDKFITKLSEIDRETPVLLCGPKWKDWIINLGFEIYGPPRAVLSEYHEILGEYLLPDLASLALGYLTVKEIPVREWKVAGGPSRMAVHPKGLVYVIDNAAHNILVFSRLGQLLQTWKKVTSYEIAISPQGEIYVIDDEDSIKIFTPGGKFLRDFAKVTNQYVHSPRGIAFSGERVYVADDGIKIFDLEGHLIHERKLLDDGRPINSRRIAIFLDGKIYVSTFPGSQVRIFEMTTLKYLGEMVIPEALGVAVAPWEEIYVSSLEHMNVFVFSPDGIYQATLNGNFRFPSNVSISPQGEIYIADAIKESIQVFERRYD
jgi:hypothetical protein